MQLHMHSYLQLLGPKAPPALPTPATTAARASSNASHIELGFMPGLIQTVFPGYNQHPVSGTPGVQPKVGPPTAIQSPNRDGNPRPPQQNPGATLSGTFPAPQPPMSLPIPEDWVEDTDYRDIRRSIGNLTCPKHVVSSAWTPEKGFAGIPVTSLHPAQFLYQGWNRYWLRWIGQGKEAYFVVARTKREMVLIGEVLTQIRNQALDIDAAATNHAVQTQTSQVKILQSRHSLNT